MLAFGDALHSALEVLMHRNLEKRISVDEAIGVFETKLSERFDKIPQWMILGHFAVDDNGKEKWIPPPDRAEMSQQAYRIMTDLLAAPELRRATVLMNELKLKDKIDRLDDRAVQFSGFVDLIFSAPAPRGKKTLLYICDYKSCSWGWPNEKKRDKDVLSQLFLYKHFVCKALGLDPSDVRTVFILMKKRPGKGQSSIEFFPVSAGPKSMEEAIELLQKSVTGMSCHELTKNRDACVNHWEVCPYKGTDLCTSS